MSVVDFLRLYRFEVTDDGKFDVNDQSGGLGRSPLRSFRFDIFFPLIVCSLREYLDRA